MKENSIELLKALTETPGVSGFESPVRKVLAERLTPFASEISVDGLGSLIAVKKGVSAEPRIMVAAHMDEVGFMVTQITDEGFVKFQTLGGWWEQVLLAQRVDILTSGGSVPGVIGAKSPHILSPEDRKQPVKMKSMFIDVGATGREEAARTGVKPGDPVIPYSPFTVCRNARTLMAKALDDRSGCAMVVELFQRLNPCELPGTVFGVMTVQEEVGLRGAVTSAEAVNPDVAVVADVTVATDTPGITADDVPVKMYLGKGPAIGFYDNTMIPHIPFRDFVIKTAEENNIPYQIEVMAGGGTDAGRIHIHRRGVPSIVIGIPVRYIHDHTGIAHIDDYENAVKLITSVVKGLNAETLNSLRYHI
ncbi:MAG: M42 family metallopeptidase [Bacillota bacterium]